MKPADGKVNRQPPTQEVRPETAEGHRRAGPPCRKDAELGASSSLLSNTSPHGWTRHLGQHFLLLLYCFSSFAFFFSIWKAKMSIWSRWRCISTHTSQTVLLRNTGVISPLNSAKSFLKFIAVPLTKYPLLS